MLMFEMCEFCSLFEKFVIFILCDFLSKFCAELLHHFQSLCKAIDVEVWAGLVNENHITYYSVHSCIFLAEVASSVFSVTLQCIGVFWFEMLFESTGAVMQSVEFF